MDFKNTYITIDTLERFSKRIGYNVVTHIDLFSYFVQNNQPKISRYFTEQNTEPDADSFDFLSKLLKECERIDNLIKINKNRFTTIDDWDLLDHLENIRISLQSIDNTSKYTRSSKSKNSWNTVSISSQYLLGQHQTIEDIAYTELNSNDEQNDWTDLAIKNNLSEIDYTNQGGVSIDIEKQIRYNANLKLKSVVDNLVGERIYGADFDKRFHFENNDLATLSYKDTFLQSLEILVLLRKGDIPEFSDMGVDPKLGVGSNINVFEYGLIRRQFDETIATDDTIRGFRIIGFEYVDSEAFFTYQADSFYNITIQDAKKL